MKTLNKISPNRIHWGIKTLTKPETLKMKDGLMWRNLKTSSVW